MKKVLFFLIILLLLITICTKVANNKEEPVNDYYLTYNEIDIKLNTLFSNTYALIGEYNANRIEDYENYQSNIYEYDYFEIETFYENNTEKISSINLTSNEIATRENIKIGSSKEEILNTYGNEYKVIGDNIYIFTHNNTSIEFIIENNYIMGIKYYKE